jgi:probable F420-dependent oxidoreductase
MKVETLLPLGKLDPGLAANDAPLDVRRVSDDAALVEEIGFDGLVLEETKDDPFIALGLAAQATTRLGLGTAVAIAFPRSPTIAAMSAWTLQKLSGGRFTLGLGPQVKGHIRRRYGLDWNPAGPWMRDYVNAVRAIWSCWQDGTPLDFQSEHYNLNLMVPLFNPGPIANPNIPIHLAAVNPIMCRIAGEVADGLRPHPVCTRKYIEEVMLPNAQQGASRTGRSLDGFQVCMKPLIATAETDEALLAKRETARARVAFYASTPAYRRAFEIHGLEDLADKLAPLARAQNWDAMPALISDEVLELFAVVGRYDQIAAMLKARYQGIATRVEFSIPVAENRDRETMANLIAQLAE